jgi:hypothetical protein
MPPNATVALDRRSANDQFVIETLMIPLVMVVFDELRDCGSEMTLAQRQPGSNRARGVVGRVCPTVCPPEPLN